MAIIERTLVLTGGRAGLTCVLNKHQFVDGATLVRGDEKTLHGLIKYMGRVYAAFEQGSPELAQAQEVKNGTGKANTDPQPGGPNSIPSGVQPSGGRPTTVPAADSVPANGSEATAQGGIPSGHGQQDAGEHGIKTDADRVQQAVNSLDKTDDECWTASGQPRVDAVANASGVTNVTREDIEATMPGYTRNDE